MKKPVDRWLLPDGIEEVLPDQAGQTEELRRTLVDLFCRWGYDYIIPPMVEFTDSLLTGSGQDIDLLTFKVTDQLSGRSLGLRADITPQVARMDAHSLKRDGVNRLCYAGHVLHTKPKFPLSSRAPLKAGVEMFGVAELEAEVEVISLLIETLAAVGLDTQYIDIGHVGVFRGLAKAVGLNDEQENMLFALLQSKSISDIDAWVNENIADEARRGWFTALPKFSGSAKVLGNAREQLFNAPEEVHAAIDALQSLADRIAERYPEAQLYYDLSELRGYHYHTGVVFGAFAPGVGNAIASGGRYDHVGEAFGRARSATGFDVDLSAVCRILSAEPAAKNGVFAPLAEDEALWQTVRQLRDAGERVITAVPGQTIPEGYQGCDRQLVLVAGKWQIESI